MAICKPHKWNVIANFCSILYIYSDQTVWSAASWGMSGHLSLPLLCLFSANFLILALSLEETCLMPWKEAGRIYILRYCTSFLLQPSSLQGWGFLQSAVHRMPVLCSVRVQNNQPCIPHQLHLSWCSSTLNPGLLLLLMARREILRFDLVSHHRS